jgi:hypothetical protein
MADEGLTQQFQQALDGMAAQYFARTVKRQSAYIEAFLQEELTHLVNHLLEGVVKQVVELFAAGDRSTHQGRSGSTDTRTVGSRTLAAAYREPLEYGRRAHPER